MEEETANFKEPYANLILSKIERADEDKISYEGFIG